MSDLPDDLEEYASLEKHSIYAATAMRQAADKIRELEEFVRVVTLHLQTSRSKSPEQHDAMFHRGYRLYVKHDVENRLHSKETRNEVD